MKRILFSLVISVLFLTAAYGYTPHTAGNPAALVMPFANTEGTENPGKPLSLLRIGITGGILPSGIPVHAHYADALGQEYILTLIPAEQVSSIGIRHDILDTGAGSSYLVARVRKKDAREALSASSLQALYDDGLRIVFRDAPGTGQWLREAGFSVTPLKPSPRIPGERTILRNLNTVALPVVQEMVNEVSETSIMGYVESLSGVTPVTIDGAPYTISTRYTDSGTPLRNATQYVHDHLQKAGYSVSFMDWKSGDLANRNIIAEMKGQGSPGKVILLVAHLDDMPRGSTAPGADDNASGCAGAMTAADIMRKHVFGKTLRFLFSTGEEQGYLGAAAYVNSLSSAEKQSIEGVINLDMIAWSTSGSSVARLHTRPKSNPSYSSDSAIAQTFSDVAGIYNLQGSLSPLETADGETASDHSVFWDAGIPAILAIEDDYNDFNPNYHTTRDTSDKLNRSYFTAFVKASLATKAHMAEPVDPASLVALNLVKSGNGTIASRDGIFTCGSSCGEFTQKYILSTLVTLDATAGQGSFLSGWSNCPSKEGSSCNVPMSASADITGTFSTIAIGGFDDVPSGNWAESHIYALRQSGITSGCGSATYCPQDNVTREQMAVFLERSLRGSSFTPPAPTGIFSDVPVSSWAAGWIEVLYSDGVTTGCGTNPLRYCPADPVTRAQMAVFLLRAKHGKDYTPPPATGTMFTDVPAGYWAASWIEQLATEGISRGCGTGTFCPDDTVRRDQMAVFLGRTFLGMP